MIRDLDDVQFAERYGCDRFTATVLANRFDYVVERDGTTLADGHTLHACIDARTHRPTRVPAWLVEEIATAEGR